MHDLICARVMHTLQSEIRRHALSTFVDELPTMAQGGRGVVVPGCPACKKRLNTHGAHWANDVFFSDVAALPTPSSKQ
jgi:hypothetical protein